MPQSRIVPIVIHNSEFGDFGRNSEKSIFTGKFTTKVAKIVSLGRGRGFSDFTAKGCLAAKQRFGNTKPMRVWLR